MRNVMGEPGWTREVFASPPVDRLKHRSSYTQTHQPWSTQDNRFAPVQGRPELSAYLALQYLQTLGLVVRFKEHPFETKEEEFGRRIKPDFFLEAVTSEGTAADPIVIEVKTARYVTEALALELRSNKQAFARFNLRYVVWTDRHPLVHGVRHNLLHMSRASGEDIVSEEVLRLRSFVASRPHTLVLDAFRERFDYDCIYAATWRGAIHFPLKEFLHERSPLSLAPSIDPRLFFRGEAPRSSSDWWGTLARA